MQKKIEKLHQDILKELIITSLEDDKAEDIVTIDLQGKSDMADYLVIATGRADRHVGAMADHLTYQLKQEGILASVEGMPQCDWVLVDAFDVVVHLFRKEVRELYNLEKMWQAELSAE